MRMQVHAAAKVLVVGHRTIPAGVDQVHCPPPSSLLLLLKQLPPLGTLAIAGVGLHLPGRRPAHQHANPCRAAAGALLSTSF